MGVSIYSFQIIGGIFLFLFHLKWFLKKEKKRKKNTAKKILDENEIKNIAVFPLSIPLSCWTIGYNFISFDFRRILIIAF